MAKLENAKFYRFVIPRQDVAVMKWMQKQLNISASIRALIHEDVRTYGYEDVTCHEIERGQKKRHEGNDADDQTVTADMHRKVRSKKSVKKSVPDEKTTEDDVKTVNNTDVEKQTLDDTVQEPVAQKHEEKKQESEVVETTHSADSEFNEDILFNNNNVNFNADDALDSMLG